MLSKLCRDDIPNNEVILPLPVDEWQCLGCGSPVGWSLTNETSIQFVDYWYITGRDAFDERLPRWCDDCVH